MASREPEPCRWVRLQDAMRNFVTTTESTQSQRHIKPLHWHLACRLVVEGGFLPDDVTPRPPFASRPWAGRRAGCSSTTIRPWPGRANRWSLEG